MSKPSPIDRETLHSLFDAIGNDPEFLAELLEEYFKDSPGQILTLEQSLVSKDAETFQRAAHTMKSTSASFGADTLSGLFKDLEIMGKSGRFEGAVPLLHQANQEFQNVKTALEAALKEL